MAKLKHHLILALAAVFSMAGVLSLLTSPALAGPPMTNDACLSKALKIRDRAIEDALEAEHSTANPVACTNFCTTNTQLTIQTELFTRQPGNAPEPIIIATIIPFPPTDLAYAQSFPHGQVAYFCDVTLENPNDITSVMTRFDRAYVAVGSASTGADPCSILQKLCEANH